MPFSGGVFTRVYNWVADKNASVKITASRMDGEDDGFAAAINAIVSQTQPFVQPLSVPNGTDALPSLSFTNDTNTGFYRKAADVIGVTANATNAVDFTEDGIKLVSGGSTIDWFEDGTFTPTVVGMSTAGAGTYTTQTGLFVRIGAWVGFSMRVVWSAHTGTGTMEVHGLPYAASSGHNYPCTIAPSAITVTAGDTIVSLVNGGATTIRIATVASGGGAITDLAIDAAGTLYISGIYKV